MGVETYATSQPALAKARANCWPPTWKALVQWCGAAIRIRGGILSSLLSTILPTPKRTGGGSLAWSRPKRTRGDAIRGHDLRVRTNPGVGDDSIKLEPLLWKGAAHSWSTDRWRRQAT